MSQLGTEDNGQRTTDKAARLGAVLSVAVGVTGIPALLLGLWSLRRLNVEQEKSSQDEERGVVRWPIRCAVTGMGLGALSLVGLVIGVISIALLRVGEVSRRDNCTNNLRQIGLAANLYHDVNGSYYPSATINPPNPLAVLAPWRATPYEKRLSWMVSLLPYIERAHPQPDPNNPNKGETPPPARSRRSPRYEAAHARFDFRQPWQASANTEAINTPLTLFLCPSHPYYQGNHKPALTHYVGICGIGPEAAMLPVEVPNAGFFGFERRIWSDPSARHRRDDVPAGLAFTMMVAESSSDNGAWASPQGALRSLNPSDQPYIGFGRPFGGMHAEGVNILLADGSVRIFAQGGIPRAFESLATLSTD